MKVTGLHHAKAGFEREEEVIREYSPANPLRAPGRFNMSLRGEVELQKVRLATMAKVTGGLMVRGSAILVPIYVIDKLL